MVAPFIQRSICRDDEILKPSLSCVALNSGLEDASKLNRKYKLRSDRILYVDEDLVVVNKPFNIQTVPGFQSNYSLALIIQDMFSVKNIEHMTPHRLDFQTSGVVVFSRNLKSLTGALSIESFVYLFI